MTETLSFGYWVRRRRKALDLTQAELAARVGCAEVTVRRIEADERRPSRQIAALLAEQLQIGPAERAAFLQAARAELAVDRLEVTTQPVILTAPDSAPTTPQPGAAVPAGTVTFLFTDIEGSTRLWEQHSQAMPIALARHDTLLREAVAAHGGIVFKTVEDSVCAAFATAPAALAAALETQRALQGEPWGLTGPLHVRMALHTGTAETRDDDYFGPPLNRLARLLSVGHGSQILISLATTELVRDQLPPEVALRDLGMHRLKDLTRPAQIFQLVAPDLPADFPPLQTLASHRTNLPIQPTPLIGREREVAAVCALLHDPNVRLVTLTGPGGVGKTRLGLQAAAELLDTFPDGVFFVALAPISDPAFVPSAIAQPLGIQETGSQPLVERIQEYLHDKRLLLVLDNFEQVLDAASLIAALLATAPDLKLLITSRALLHLSGEHTFPVPPLRLPDPKQRPSVEQLSQYDAVALFIARARAARPEFQVSNENAPAVAEICHRLDGLPLAIELAAARSAVLAPQALLARLDQRLKLLISGARDLPMRQQTLRTTIDWSYNLLAGEEQTLFARLAVFASGCTLEAAEAVCNAAGDLPVDVLDGLAALVDQSLVRQGEMEDGEPRFTMLETIREYALERLEESGEAPTIRRQHAQYYLALAEAEAPGLWGEQQHQGSLALLEPEHDNLRAALVWSQGPAGSAEAGLRLAAALAGFWYAHGYLREGLAWLAGALAQPGAAAPSLARANALRGAGWMANELGDLGAAHLCYDECLALCRALGDRRGSAAALADHGNITWGQGDYARAASLCEESLALCQELGDRQGSAWALCWLGSTVRDQGDYVQAMARFEASLALYQELENTWGRGLVLNSMGDAALLQGDNARATALYQEALAWFREAGHRDLIVTVRSNLGRVAHAQGDDAQALALLEESVAHFRDVGHKWSVAWELQHLSAVVYAQGDDVRAAAVLREALGLQQQLGLKGMIAGSLERCAGLAARQGQPERGARLFGAAEALRTALGAPLPPAERAAYEHDVAADRTQLDAATFAAAWAEGRALPLEQAIADALSEDD